MSGPNWWQHMKLLNEIKRKVLKQQLLQNWSEVANGTIASMAGVILEEVVASWVSTEPYQLFLIIGEQVCPNTSDLTLHLQS